MGATASLKGELERGRLNLGGGVGFRLFVQGGKDHDGRRHEDQPFGSDGDLSRECSFGDQRPSFSDHVNTDHVQ